MHNHFLIDDLQDSDIRAPSNTCVEIHRIIIQRDCRTSLFLHPDSTVTFPSIPLGTHAELRSAIALKEVVWDKCMAEILFTISLVPESGEDVVLFSKSLDVGTREEDRAWVPLRIDLTEWEGTRVQLRFETRAEGDPAYAWAAFANPILSSEQPKATPRVRDDSNPHVILLTSDALSRRFLGCYGGTDVDTPHIDALAEDSTLFENASSQSTCTLGAYASMLSGKAPPEHGLLTEWGSFPSGVPSLPVLLHQAGFHTQLLTSEDDLTRPAFGFKQLFNHSVDSISNPAQDGSITARCFERVWDQRPDSPTFSWVQFFDTHPPSLPPKELSRKYYSGDPEQPGFRPELVKKIYGLESLVEMENVIEDLEAGHPLPGQLRERLLATAWALKGKQKNGPDLYDHLLNIPPRGRLDMTPNAFGYWLENETTNCVTRGKASQELLHWLRMIIQEMRFIQKSITGWMDGVKDFQYSVSQYKACTEYFDQQIGRVISHLKETNTYDQTLIILTSPHGEILSYENIAFHHHLPHPYVYDVPLLVKAPGQPKAQRLKGMTEHRDVLPSILEALRLEQLTPKNTTGQSWYKQVVEGTNVERSYSQGYDVNSILTSLYDPPYLYVKSHDRFHISKNWTGDRDQEFLFECTGGLEGMTTIMDNNLMNELSEKHQKT